VGSGGFRHRYQCTPELQRRGMAANGHGGGGDDDVDEQL
jgi:hypothetical protein